MSSINLEGLEIKEATPSIAPSIYENFQYTKKWRILLALGIGISLIGLCVLVFYLTAEAKRPKGEPELTQKEKLAILSSNATMKEWRTTVESEHCFFSTQQKCHEDFGEVPVFLLVLGGLRIDQASEIPALLEFEKCGASTKTLVPSYPTFDYPNLYSIATGLFPESHGIVSFNMYDDDLHKNFTAGSPNSLDPDWWRGEPIWNTLEKMGKKTATFLWPGSNVRIQDTQPTFYQSDKVEFVVRMQKILDWILLPKEERPHLIMMYYEEPVSTAQTFGPFSPQTKEQLAIINKGLDELMSSLQRSNIFNCVDIIVASDHGVAASNCKSSIYVDKMVEEPIPGRLFTGPVGRIDFYDDADEAAQNRVIDKLECQDGALHVLKKNQVPKRYHYTTGSRIGDLVLDTKPGYRVATDSDAKCQAGEFGYDDLSRTMQGVLVAQGPHFKVGFKTDSFRNIEIYNLLSHMLNVEPAPNNGTRGSLLHLLKSNFTSDEDFEEPQRSYLQESIKPVPVRKIDALLENSDASRENCPCVQTVLDPPTKEKMILTTTSSTSTTTASPTTTSTTTTTEPSTTTTTEPSTTTAATTTTTTTKPTTSSTTLHSTTTSSTTAEPIAHLNPIIVTTTTEPATELETEEVIEQATESVTEPTSEQETEQVVEQTIETTTELETEQVVEPTVEKTAELETEQTMGQAKELAVQPETEQVVGQAKELAAEPEQVVEQTAETATEPEAEQIGEETIELETEQVVETTVETTTELETEQTMGQAKELAVQPETEHAVGQAKELAAEPETEQVVEQTTETATEPEAEQTGEKTIEPTAEPETEQVVGQAKELAAELETEQIMGQIIEPEIEQAIEQSTEPETEQATEQSTEPDVEPTTRPETKIGTEQVIQPTTEPAIEPSTEPVTEPATDPTAELITETPTISSTIMESTAHSTTESITIAPVESTMTLAPVAQESDTSLVSTAEETTTIITRPTTSLESTRMTTNTEPVTTMELNTVSKIVVELPTITESAANSIDATSTSSTSSTTSSTISIPTEELSSKDSKEYNLSVVPETNSEPASVPSDSTSNTTSPATSSSPTSTTTANKGEEEDLAAQIEQLPESLKVMSLTKYVETNAKSNEEAKLQNKHCPWGFPSLSAPEVSSDSHHILLHSSHILGFPESLDLATWTSFTITKKRFTELEKVRSGSGYISPEDRKRNLPVGCWISDSRLQRSSNYQCSNIFQREVYEAKNASLRQLFPEEFELRDTLKKEGFLLSNMAPLMKGFEHGPRRIMLEAIEKWTRQKGSLNVIHGPVFDYNYDGKRDNFTHLRNTMKPLIPSNYFYVVTLCNETQGSDDSGKDDDAETSFLSCPLINMKVYSFIFPNSENDGTCHQSPRDYLRYHAASLADVEDLTSMRFFKNMNYRHYLRLRARQHLRIPLF